MHTPISLMEFTQLRAARVHAQHVLDEQCRGNWQDSHFCSHTRAEQRDALHCGTVCHGTAAQDVGSSLYTTSSNYRLNYSDTVNALQLWMGRGVLLWESGCSFYLITDWVI